MNDLPDGWATATVGELSTLIQYGSSSKTSDVASGIPILRMGNIVAGLLVLKDLKYLPKDHDEFPELLLQPQDVLFNRTNSPELVGKTAVYEGFPSPCSFASYLLRVRLHGYEPKLLAHYINSADGRRWISSVVSQQVGQANVNGSKLRELTVPIPPLAEQRRIVAKVGALTAQSRRAKEALDAIPPLIEQFRQSVLAAAFRGDLTAAWREKNPEVEPAEKLLTRIRAERRKRWEEGELAKMRAKGKAPGDDRWKEKYEEPEPVDTEGLPELPEGWAWASVAQLSLDIVDCPHSTPAYGSGDCFAVDTNCMIPGAVVAEKLRRVELETYALRTRRLVPRGGDVVFAREGTVGTAASLPEVPSVCLGQRVMLMRPSTLLCDRWLEQALMCPHVVAQYAKKLVGSTVAHLNVGDVVRLAIPIPPVLEQDAVLMVLFAGLRRIESVKRRTEELKSEQASLDRSILAKAFRGELVPQDPSDEPASVLLERIRAERSAAPAAKKKESKRTPKR